MKISATKNALIFYAAIVVDASSAHVMKPLAANISHNVERECSR